jgi:hypothetical protein
MTQELDLSMKTREGVKSKGTRLGCPPYLLLGLKGVFGEVNTLGQDWLNVQAGVSQLTLTPAGQDTSQTPNYLLVGCTANKYLSGTVPISSSSFKFFITMHRQHTVFNRVVDPD